MRKNRTFPRALRPKLRSGSQPLFPAPFMYGMQEWGHGSSFPRPKLSFPIWSLSGQALHIPIPMSISRG